MFLKLSTLSELFLGWGSARVGKKKKTIRIQASKEVQSQGGLFGVHNLWKQFVEIVGDEEGKYRLST